MVIGVLRITLFILNIKMELCRDCIMRTLEVDVDLLLLGLYSEVINWRIEGF
jgi:hypothetical protein